MSETKKSSKVAIPTAVRESTAKPSPKQNVTKVDKCDCKSEFQDKQFGVGMRLKNSTSKGFRCTFRCTVCRKII